MLANKLIAAACQHLIFSSPWLPCQHETFQSIKMKSSHFAGASNQHGEAQRQCQPTAHSLQLPWHYFFEPFVQRMPVISWMLLKIIFMLTVHFQRDFFVQQSLPIYVQGPNKTCSSPLASALLEKLCVIYLGVWLLFVWFLVCLFGGWTSAGPRRWRISGSRGDIILCHRKRYVLTNHIASLTAPLQLSNPVMSFPSENVLERQLCSVSLF